MNFLRDLLTGALGAALAIVIAGCDSTSYRSDPDLPARVACQSKLDEIVGKLQAFEASKRPTAKRAAPDSNSADTTLNRIQVFRGYPPVSGINAGGTDTSGGYVVRWVPPADSRDSDISVPAGSNTTIPPLDPGPLPAASDTANPGTIPQSVSVIQVVSNEGYRAHIVISDEGKRTVRTLDQEFGSHGEFDNPQGSPGKVSFLVWDKRDEAGRDVPDGVYLWVVRFTYGSGAVEEMTQLTGVLGPVCEAALAD